MARYQKSLVTKLVRKIHKVYITPHSTGKSIREAFSQVPEGAVYNAMDSGFGNGDDYEFHFTEEVIQSIEPQEAPDGR